MQETELFNNTYQIIREIGRGGTGVVFQAYHLRLQKYVVIKQIRVGPLDAEALRREADLLKNLHHEYLPQVYDCFVSNEQVYTIIDYIPGKNLAEIFSESDVIPEHLAIKWLRQLAEVLDYLHTRPIPILHSDIKPENIILTEENNICLIDFNISLDGAENRKPAGFSPHFASPEQIWMAEGLLAGQHLDWELDAATDIYSAGATFYYLLTGLLPVGTEVNAPLESFGNLPYSPGLLAVIDKCMAWEREKRYPSAAKLLKALENVKKQDKRYRRYLFAQALTLLGTTILAVVGIAFLATGIKSTRVEAFYSDYSAFSDSVSSGNTELTQILGQNLLNEGKYRPILENSKEERAYILHSLGDACVYDGRPEDAIYYYSQAIVCTDADDLNLGTYYYDYALTLLETGRIDEAQSVLELGVSAGISSTALLAMKADLACRQGKTSECVEMVWELLENDASEEYAIRACLIAASAVGTNSQEGIGWLEKAKEYDGTVRDHRALAVAFLKASQDFPDEKKFAQSALELYKELNDRAHPSLEDQIGLAVSHYALGENETCIEVLLVCEANGDKDYRIDFYLAFSYFELGMTSEATARCNSALKKIEETRYSDKPIYFVEDHDALTELARILEERG